MASIICTECGAEDDAAVDMDWTLGYKKGMVVNATCLRCGGGLMRTWLQPDVLLVDSETDEVLFYNNSNREA